MAVRIVFTRADGGLSVVTPVRARREGETVPQYLNAIITRAMPAGGTNPRVIDSADLPAQLGLRAAWQDTGAEVIVHLPGARVVRLAALAARRREVLRDLTEAREAAADRGQAVLAAQLLARRTALRDYDLAADLAALGTAAAIEAYSGPPLLTDPV